MSTLTGREMAAKIRDGEFDTVSTIANLNTYNARGEKQGEAIGTRIELPESTLEGRLSTIRFSIDRVKDGTAYVKRLQV